ncbi:hypothetical protein [Paradesulfitobacterium ferrireducens]|uniref:hypothetical protein n=1 Tax=Paradesulfitobacterium ferrireducens TaxID=2816476 RepID=UPI001A8C747E|nr:hypothetical protein [Paradesulfitobacterium ferrireducens]
MGYLWPVLSAIIAVPLAYLAGYKLKRFVPKDKRFAVGFFSMVGLFSLLLLISWLFDTDFFTRTGVGTALGIGFMLGMAGTPEKR